MPKTFLNEPPVYTIYFNIIRQAVDFGFVLSITMIHTHCTHTLIIHIIYNGNVAAMMVDAAWLFGFAVICLLILYYLKINNMNITIGTFQPTRCMHIYVWIPICYVDVQQQRQTSIYKSTYLSINYPFTNK